MAQAAVQTREFSLSDEEFAFLGALATAHTGIAFPPHKRDLMYGRLVRRLRATGCESFAQYCAWLQGDDAAEEIDEMVNAVTTNLTSFFREAHHFEHLARELVVPFAQSAEARRLRIWSAGCSSGMEAYSIAMTLLAADAHIARRDAKILATDIDSRMLAAARAATYAASDLARIPEAHRHGLMTHADGSATLHPSLQQLVAVRQLNLMNAWPMQGKFDAIFCRNVVIYFDKKTKQRLFERFAEALVPHGLLYIGHSENLTGISDRFRLVGRTTYRRVD